MCVHVSRVFIYCIFGVCYLLSVVWILWFVFDHVCCVYILYFWRVLCVVCILQFVFVFVHVCGVDILYFWRVSCIVCCLHFPVCVCVFCVCVCTCVWCGYPAFLACVVYCVLFAFCGLCVFMFLVCIYSIFGVCCVLCVVCILLFVFVHVFRVNVLHFCVCIMCVSPC